MFERRLPLVDSLPSPAHAPLRAAAEVLFVVPPDFDAPAQQKVHRFPPEGPALVAACVEPLGWSVRLCDLEQSLIERPLELNVDVCADEARVTAYLRGEAEPAIEDFAEALLERLAPARVEHLALSLERHTQMSPACILGRAAKLRWGCPVIIGGSAAQQCHEFLTRIDARGIDFVTRASAPSDIGRAFTALREVPRGRMARVEDPAEEQTPASAETWPVPNFGIYDLDRYRRDPLSVEPLFPGYDGRVGQRLILPYHFTFGCQFACRFCQNGGRQSNKSVEAAVRDLAVMAERYDARDFFLVDTQINVVATDFARALIAADVGLRWSDSYRVLPHHPGELELMARSGCVGITVGVESGSDDVLKRMVKGHRRAQASRMIREAHEHNLMTRVNMLTCFPGEKPHHHQESCDWIRENAFAIDDLAPSSFYLLHDSPIGRAPEKYGVVIRGPRRVEGSYRFRKFIGSLAFDEVDGYRWEEREPLLRQTEADLRQAWLEGRGENAPVRELKSAVMFGLRSVFANKAEAYAAARAWLVSGPQRTAGSAASCALGLAVRGDSCEAPRERGAMVLEPVVVETAELAERVRAVLSDATPETTRYASAGSIAHLLLFRDDDYLCFAGALEAGAPSRVTVENILASRFRAAGLRRLYGRLSPGTRLLIDEKCLTFDGEAREALHRGLDFEFVSFRVVQTRTP